MAEAGVRDVDESADCGDTADEAVDAVDEGVRRGCSVRSVVAGVRPSKDC